MTTPEPVLYWHVYAAHDEENDLYATMVVGYVPLGPDDEIADGIRVRDVVLEPSALSDGDYANIGGYSYVATFDHEPTPEDLDSIAPEGHKSTDLVTEGTDTE